MLKLLWVQRNHFPTSLVGISWHTKISRKHPKKIWRPWRRLHLALLKVATFVREDDELLPCCHTDLRRRWPRWLRYRVFFHSCHGHGFPKFSDIDCVAVNIDYIKLQLKSWSTLFDAFDYDYQLDYIMFKLCLSKIYWCLTHVNIDSSRSQRPLRQPHRQSCRCEGRFVSPGATAKPTTNTTQLGYMGYQQH